MQVEQSTLSTAEVPIVEGRAGVAFTRSGEHTLVLERNGEVVRRTPIVLPPGGVHRIER